MAQLLTFLSAETDISKLKGSGTVVKNQSPGPFQVDAEGTLLHSNQILMFSEMTSTLQEGLKKGKLIVLKTFTAEKTSSKKEDAPRTAVEGSGKNKEEVPQTVAQSNEKTSVQ